MNTLLHILYYANNPNISYLGTFGCVVYLLIAPTQCTKMALQQRLGIYVDFNSPSIIRYLESLIGNVFTAHIADCHFNESLFSPLERKSQFQKNDEK